MRELATVMAIETETEMARTARQAAATSTQIEWRRCCWLEIVSTSAKAEENEMATYQCRLGHPSDPQTTRTETLNVDGDADTSNSKL